MWPLLGDWPLNCCTANRSPNCSTLALTGQSYPASCISFGARQNGCRVSVPSSRATAAQARKGKKAVVARKGQPVQPRGTCSSRPMATGRMPQRCYKLCRICSLGSVWQQQRYRCTNVFPDLSCCTQKQKSSEVLSALRVTTDCSKLEAMQRTVTTWETSLISSQRRVRLAFAGSLWCQIRPEVESIRFDQAARLWR